MLDKTAIVIGEGIAGLAIVPESWVCSLRFS